MSPSLPPLNPPFLLPLHSRAFVRAACGDPYLPVPSPTFLLQNVYDETLGDGA